MGQLFHPNYCLFCDFFFIVVIPALTFYHLEAYVLILNLVKKTFGNVCPHFLLTSG